MKMPPVKMLPKNIKGQPWYKKFLSWFSKRKWIFTEEYLIDLPDGRKVLIPKGFITDFASIPRIFWPIIQPTGSLMLAAIVHDFVYRRGYLRLKNGVKLHLSRKEADDIFYEISKEQTGVKIGSWLAWAGVRLGGWWAWHKNKKYRSKR